MGISLKGIGRAISKGVKDVGHVVGSVASNPIVEAGLGALTGGAAVPIIAGAAGGLLKPGGNIGGAVKGAVTGGVAGKGGSILRSVGSRVLSGGGGSAAGVGDYGGGDGSDVPVDSSGAGGGSGGGWMDTIGNVAGAAGKMLPAVGSGLAAYEGVQNANKSNALAQQALDMAKQDYASRAPLRDLALSRLTNPETPDLSFLNDPGHPYARQLPVVGKRAS